MTISIEFASEPLWQGRTEYHTYTLHRARLEDLEEGGYADGYVLRWGNGVETDVAEAYGEDSIEPGNGFYGDWIQDCRVADRPLPRPDRRDVERFKELFEELCERDGIQLQESEILMV